MVDCLAINSLPDRKSLTGICGPAQRGERHTAGFNTLRASVQAPFVQLPPAWHSSVHYCRTFLKHGLIFEAFVPPSS